MTIWDDGYAAGHADAMREAEDEVGVLLAELEEVHAELDREVERRERAEAIGAHLLERFGPSFEEDSGDGPYDLDALRQRLGDK